MEKAALVHLASGIGNTVLATPLLVALADLQFQVDLLLDADYPSTVDLLRPWSLVRRVLDRRDSSRMDSYSHVIPAIPPFYWSRFHRYYAGGENVVRRPPDALFYQNEQEYYLAFARALGFPSTHRPFYRLPIGPSDRFDVGQETLVIAPGCKTGEMALKRWSFYPELASRFERVAVVGTCDDLRDARGGPFCFPAHVESYVDRLSLRETAELMAGAGAVVGNDSGLCHIAGAVGTPTLILFGPTPHLTLGHFPGNVYIFRAGLACEPCWFGKRFDACQRGLDCLNHLSVDSVAAGLRRLMGHAGAERS